MRLLALVLLLVPTLALAGANDPQQQRHGDWIRSGEFKGKRILIASYYWEGQQIDSVPMNNVPRVLREMGFQVEVLRAPPHLPALEGYDQVWVVSGSGSSFDATDVARLKRYLKSGRGVYVLADNSPYVHEANLIGRELDGVGIEGDYPGGKLIHVVAPGAIKKMVDAAMAKGDMEKLGELRRAGFLNGKLYAEDHELLSGISEIYEGITLSHLSTAPDLEVLIRASDNQSLVAVSTRQGEKLVYDCGFTRLYCGWPENAVTSTHWYRNVAAYLMGKRRNDLPLAPVKTTQLEVR